MIKIFGSRSFVSFVVLFLAVFATIIFIWLIFPKEPAPVSLRILGDSFSGYSTFRDPDFKEALKKSQIGLTYEDELDQAKRAEELKSGKADLILTTLDQFIRQSTYSSGKIVGLIDRSNGADAVLLNTPKYPNLNSLEDLQQFIKIENSQGRKPNIALAQNTPSEFLAFMLTTKEHFKLSDFQIINKKDAKEVWQYLTQLQDAPVAVLWEPYVTQARKQGYTVVFSSKEKPRVIIDVIVASNKSIDSKSDNISKLLEIYYNRIHERIFDPSLMDRQISKDDKNLSSEDAKAIRESIQFFTLPQSHHWLSKNKPEEKIKYIISLLNLVGKPPQESQKFFQPQELQQFYQPATAAKNVEKLHDSCKTTSGNNIDEFKEICKFFRLLDVTKKPKIGEVKFDERSGKLKDQSKQILDELVEVIEVYDPKTVAVKVTGHASGSQGSSLNNKLSKERAKVVGQYLKEQLEKYNIKDEGKSVWYPLGKVPPDDPLQSRAEIRLIPRQ